MPGWRSSLASPKIESKRRLEANCCVRGMNIISPSQANSHREGLQVVYAPAVALYRSATNSPHKTRQMKPSYFLAHAQIKELQAQMELLQEEVRQATSAKALYQKALGFANASKKISELGDMRSKRTR